MDGDNVAGADRPLTLSPEDLLQFKRIFDPRQCDVDDLVRSLRDAACGVPAARIRCRDWLRAKLGRGFFPEAFHEVWDQPDRGSGLVAMAELQASEIEDFVDFHLTDPNPDVQAELERKMRSWADTLRAWAETPREDFLDAIRLEQEAEEGTTVDAVVARLNRRYFTVTMDGGYAVGRVDRNPEFGHEEVKFFSETAIKRDLDRRRAEVAEGDKVVSKGQGTVWLGHPAREHFRRVTFNPDPSFSAGEGPDRVLNTFRGFSIPSRAGDASPIEDLMRFVLCGDDDGAYDFLTRWSALAVQRPHEAAGVVVAMTGEKRTGKGAFGRSFLALSNPHSLQVTQTDQLTGKFNAHLATCLSLFVDEAFWGGDRRAENALKALVTEPSFMAEPKGVDPFPVPNRLKIVMATNDAWVAPTDAGDTRYCVLSPSREASDAYKRSVGFGRLLHGQGQPRPEVIAAWRARLERVDVDGWRAEEHVPETEALQRQRELTGDRDPMTSWWRSVLERGPDLDVQVPGWPDGEGQAGPITKAELGADLRHHIRSRKRWFHGDEPGRAAIAQWLKGTFGYDVKANVGTGASRRKGWLLPPVAEARADFERRFRTGRIDWDA